MDLFVRDLAPGQNYALQVRAVNSTGVSPWSNLFTVNSGTDTIRLNPPTGLTWDVHGTSFAATWVPPVANMDGSPVKDFRDYLVVISSPNKPGVTGSYYTEALRFDFGYEANLALFGTPQATVTIEVFARDQSYLVSTAATATATNPAPPAPINVTTTPGGDAYLVTWSPVEEPGQPGMPLHDLRIYEVHHSTTSAAFVPSASTLKAQTTANIITIPTTSYLKHYVKVVAVDVFGTKTASTSTAFSEVTPINPAGTGPDTTPPRTPEDLTADVTEDLGDPLNRLAYATVSWNTSGLYKNAYEDAYNEDPNDDPDLAGYTLEYGPQGGVKQYMTLRKPPGGTEVQNKVTIFGLKRGVIYEFKVASFDVNLNYSPAHGPVTDTAPADQTPPALVANLDLSVSRANFIATWSANTESDFGYYEYWVTGNGITKGPFRTNETRYELTLEQNRKWFVTGGAGATKPAASIQFRVRAWDINGNAVPQVNASNATATNPVPGNVTGGDWQVNGTSFVGRWDANTEDDFSHYQYYLRGSKTGAVYTTLGPFRNETARFTLDLANNRQLFGSAFPYMEIQVENVDLLEQTSISRYIQLRQNPVPAAPASITITTQYDAIVLNWPGPAEDDIQYFRVYVANNSSFTGQTKVYEGIGNSFTYQTDQFATDHWFRITAVDVFDQESAYRPATQAYRPRSAYTVDTQAPGSISAPVRTAYVVNDNQIQTTLDWTGVSDTDLSHYEVRYSPYNFADTIPRQWQYLTVAEDEPRPVTVRYLEPKTYYVYEVRAVDFSANASAWVQLLPQQIAADETPDAKVNTALIVEAPGVVRSSNYSSGVSGWQLSGSGLDVSEGRISAAALEIQSAPNIALAAYAGMSFHPNFYRNVSPGRTLVASVVTATINQVVTKYGLNTLEVAHPGTAGTAYVFLSSSTTGYNTPIDGGTTYIASIWVYNPGATDADARLRVRQDNDGLYPGDTTVSIPAGQWKRVEVRFTPAASATKVVVALYMPTSGATLNFTALQIEPQISGQTKASAWNPPGATSIDGGIIRTGEMVSTQMSNVDPTQPAWSLNTQGNMQVGNAVVRGELVVGVGSGLYDPNTVVKSYGYTAGSQGWAIKGNGDVEFNDGVFRGDLEIGTGAAKVSATEAGLWIGDTTFANAPFSVTPQGALKTTDFSLASGNMTFDSTGLSLYDSTGEPTVVFSSTGGASIRGNILAESITTPLDTTVDYTQNFNAMTVGSAPTGFVQQYREGGVTTTGNRFLVYTDPSNSSNRVVRGTSSAVANAGARSKSWINYNKGYRDHEAKVKITIPSNFPVGADLYEAHLMWLRGANTSTIFSMFMGFSTRIADPNNANNSLGWRPSMCYTQIDSTNPSTVVSPYLRPSTDLVKPGDTIYVKMKVVGKTVQAKWWYSTETEPGWQHTSVQNTMLNSGTVGWSLGVQNLSRVSSAEMFWDDLEVTTFSGGLSVDGAGNLFFGSDYATSPFKISRYGEAQAAAMRTVISASGNSYLTGSGTTYADASHGAPSINFTAPASGSVLIQWGAGRPYITTTNEHRWCLLIRDATTLATVAGGISGSAAWSIGAQSYSANAYAPASFHRNILNGLTPGTAYQIRHIIGQPQGVTSTSYWYQYHCSVTPLF